MLTPPLLALPTSVRERPWDRDWMPEFILLAAAYEESGRADGIEDALAIVDALVPGGDKPFTGTISSFALVPADRRAEARRLLGDGESPLTPMPLRHILPLYPECPAGWLFEAQGSDAPGVDPELGVSHLKGLVGRLQDRHEILATKLRLLVMHSLLRREKIRLALDSDVLPLVPRFPWGLNEAERGRVAVWSMAFWQALGLGIEDSATSEAWRAHFWRQNYGLSACEPPPRFGSAGRQDVDAEEEPNPAGRFWIDVRADFTAALDALGRDLLAAQDRVTPDLYEPTSDEVRLGLASRQYRLLRRLVEHVDLWRPDVAPHVFRSLIDARIVSAWLIGRGNAELYRRFKDYGVGKLKLYKLHVADRLVEAEGERARALQDLHDSLDRQVNWERWEEFQPIDLGGTFGGTNIREMAVEAGLKDLYDLGYQPLSSEAHGEWPSLLRHDLDSCRNPLHLFHQRATFAASAPEPDAVWVVHATTVAADAIEQIFESFGVDVEASFVTCIDAMRKAIGPVSAHRQEAEMPPPGK
jgi:hypothetical protein